LKNRAGRKDSYRAADLNDSVNHFLTELIAEKNLAEQTKKSTSAKKNGPSSARYWKKMDPCERLPNGVKETQLKQ
jgi:hypothetical protein